MKPNVNRDLWQKASAMAQKMDETYANMERTRDEIKRDALQVAQNARCAEEAADAATGAMEHMIEIDRKAALVYLLITLANMLIGAGITAVVVYFFR